MKIGDKMLNFINTEIKGPDLWIHILENRLD